MFGYKEGDFPITEDVSGRIIALLFFNNLKEEQIDYVVEKLKEGIEISVYVWGTSVRIRKGLSLFVFIYKAFRPSSGMPF